MIHDSFTAKAYVWFFLFLRKSLADYVRMTFPWLSNWKMIYVFLVFYVDLAIFSMSCKIGQSLVGWPHNQFSYQIGFWIGPDPGDLGDILVGQVQKIVLVPLNKLKWWSNKKNSLVPDDAVGTIGPWSDFEIGSFGTFLSAVLVLGIERTGSEIPYFI